MADVLFAKNLKTLIILNRLHKQNQEILRVHTPILQPSSHNKVVSLTTFFTFLQDLKEQPYPQTMFTFREMFASLAPFFNFREMFASLAPFFNFRKMFTSLAPFFTAAVVIVLTPFVKEHIPSAVSHYLVSMYEKWLSRFSTPQVTLVIEEKGNLKIRNQIYVAARAHLRALISSSTKPKRFKVNKQDRESELTIDIVENEEVVDIFNGIRLKWKLYSEREDGGLGDRYRYFELSFDKGFENKVLDSYLPDIVGNYERIQADDKVVKLFSNDNVRIGSAGVIFKHPMTFAKLAMDPKQKEMLKDDLKSFVERKDFYEDVGKTWKRGYLLYGAPGTGKSSLIAAMANYLKFNIYDLNLSGRYTDEDLRSILLSTTNRSILVIEDIVCGAELDDQRKQYTVSILYSHKILFSLPLYIYIVNYCRAS